MDILSRKVEVALELIPTFKSLLSSDVLKGTTWQPSAGCLQAVTLPTRLEVIKGEGGLLEVFKPAHSHFSSWAQIGPQGVRVKDKGPRMRIGSYNVQ